MTFQRIFPLLTVLLLWSASMAAGDNYTVIVSLDGFRWDYVETFDTPFLCRVGAQGVSAVMTPSFPSKTFPNHYTLATGLYPDHHGIISNTFAIRGTDKVFSLGDKDMRSDPQYFGGDPIWHTARRQGLKTATVFWVGSDVAIQGGHPDYWRDYLTQQISLPQRADEVVRLLSLPEAERPRLVMAYFEQPDASGHLYGPISSETRRATEYMDLLLEDMWQRLQQLPHADRINLIITGDHGMTWLSPERKIDPWLYLKKEWIQSMYNDFPVLINAAKSKYVDTIVKALRQVDHIRVWKRGQLPEYLHYGDNANMSDIIVLPDMGWSFTDGNISNSGSHGYDPTGSDMWVGFCAIGPDFKQGYRRSTTLRNVCVYPLLCHLLGIEPSPNDGTLDEVADLLRK